MKLAVRSGQSGTGRDGLGLGLVYFVMRSSMLRGSRMKVGRVTLLRSAPGLS